MTFVHCADPEKENEIGGNMPGETPATRVSAGTAAKLYVPSADSVRVSDPVVPLPAGYCQLAVTEIVSPAGRPVIVTQGVAAVPLPGVVLLAWSQVSALTLVVGVLDVEALVPPDPPPQPARAREAIKAATKKTRFVFIDRPSDLPVPRYSQPF